MAKTRLYGEPETVAAVESSDYTKSGFVREAVQEKIEREGLQNGD